MQFLVAGLTNLMEDGIHVALVLLDLLLQVG